MRKQIIFAVALSLLIVASLLAFPFYTYTIDYKEPSGGDYVYEDSVPFTTYEGGAGATWDIDDDATYLKIHFWSDPEEDDWETDNPSSTGYYNFPNLTPYTYTVTITVKYEDTQGFDCGTWQPLHLER